MNAVAPDAVNSRAQMRPLRPANESLCSRYRVPGALFPNAVAIETLNSITLMRPLRPARIALNSGMLMPGASSFASAAP